MDKQTRDAMSHALQRCAQGVTPPNVALMQLCMETQSEAAAQAALLEALAAADAAGLTDAAERLHALQRCWRNAPQAFAAISSISALARERAHSARPTTEDIATLFDCAVTISADAAVALYSLGDTTLLASATAEIVARMEEWQLFDADSRVLDVGCGSGRFVEALAPRVAEITGIDIAQALLAVARARIERLANARIMCGSGRDLSEVCARFDLILAVDSFPYLVAAGVVEAHFRDCAKLLDVNGTLLILNYSYRGNLDADRADVAAFAHKYGLRVLRDGTHDFSVWDGASFLLRKDA